MLWQAFKVQRRVIGALMIRETLARFGRENLGFGWVIAEPLVFALPVLGMWSLIRGRYDHGVPMLGMAWSGYLPILLFRHVCGRMLWFVRQSAGILYHKQVSIFDLFFARALLEILSNLAAMAISGVVLYILGAIDPPQNWGLFYLGYFYMCWWSIAVALIVGGLCERSELVEKFWMPFSYMYMPVSGFFFLASWLPDQIRGWALDIVPAIHAYEMIRAGLFGPVFRYYYDPFYVSLVLAALTVFGLKVVRDARQFVVLE